jgi:hypothetical protein
MSLLTIVRAACDRIGLERPTTAVSATDQTARSLLAYANEEGENLCELHPWRKLRKEYTFTTVAAEQQTASIPDDYLRMLGETWWNRTRNRPLYGPKTPAEWQQIKGWTSSPVVDTFILRGDFIYIDPVPPAGETIAYEYLSSKWVNSAGNFYTEFQADADTTLVPEALITLGVIWRFKQSRGLAWEGDYGKYETRLKQAMMNDQPVGNIDLSYQDLRGPAVVVPDGSWNP